MRVSGRPRRLSAAAEANWTISVCCLLPAATLRKAGSDGHFLEPYVDAL